ncbi:MULTISPECIES: D-cysteine desulfhydrase family protein [unclassified Pseudomonas]|uniref:D-cysteine desulfhydrase family protein n=1 Tax=unclassified Pseudomonas TaxID=196821 RepID=UPI00128D15FF|nr:MULTISPECIES: D-cysteine desulfhydrase family protein [unclassified Pseudomonas]MPQ71557.1 pyridoxal-phosphate dependent enzyme [Pseudomonas sp. MWU12-2323]
MTASLDNTLATFPRARLLEGPTPIQRAYRLEQQLGAAAKGIGLYLKRDDFMALGGGGNKLRKLEFHLGAALHQHIDTLITVGGLQSNHARLTAAAAARLGVDCELMLTQSTAVSGLDYEYNGNRLLDELFGARLHLLPAGADSLAVANQRAAQLQEAGRKVLVIPVGGSTALGSLGYASCAQEIARQEARLGLHFERVFVANGSAGTHAGLAAGFEVLGRGAALVKSWSVLAEETVSAERTWQLTRDTLDLLGHPHALERASIQVNGSQRGCAYGVPTEAMLEAVRLLARSEGLLVDPVYSGKALAGLLADLRDGRYQSGDNLLFVMTGGSPGLYAYRESLQRA